MIWRGEKVEIWNPFAPFLWCCTENLGSCLLLPHIETRWSTPLCFHGNWRWCWGGDDSHAWPPGLAAPQFTMQRAAQTSTYSLALVGATAYKRLLFECVDASSSFISPVPPSSLLLSPPLQAPSCSGARERRSSGGEGERGSAVSPRRKNREEIKK